MGDKDHFVGLFAQIHLGINFLSPLIRMLSSSWCGRECFSRKNVCPAFRWTGKVREQSDLSQGPSAQNNQYVKVMYFMMACAPQSYSTQEAKGLGSSSTKFQEGH